MDEDASKVLARRDWKVVISDDLGEIQYTLRGSKVSSPQRYQLLALLLLFITLINPQPLTAVIGLWLAGWSSRRFKLSVSSDRGVELVSILLVPYKRLRLPLISTRLRVIEINSTHMSKPLPLAQESVGDSSHRLVDLALTHPELRDSPLLLMRLAYPQGIDLCRKFASWAHMSHQRRSISSTAPLALFKSEPGEWVIALLDLFPNLLGPRRTFSDVNTKLSYWAPRQASIIISSIAIILAFMIALISPFIAMSLIFISLASLCAVREHVYIDHHHIIWRRSLFGITNHEREFSSNLHVSIEKGIHTPSGLSVNLTDPSVSHESIVIGKPWDAAWIYREINRGLARHS